MIKLETNWNYSCISEASWPRVTPMTLKNWWVYLYGNRLYKTRRVRSYFGWSVIYDDDICPWECSASHFCRVCPTEATPEEIEFLNEEYLK